MHSYKNELASELVASECFGFVMVFFVLTAFYLTVPLRDRSPCN